ncbi:DUF6053 domain-containing protein [Lysobacter gummosus]
MLFDPLPEFSASRWFSAIRDKSIGAEAPPTKAALPQNSPSHTKTRRGTGYLPEPSLIHRV